MEACLLLLCEFRHKPSWFRINKSRSQAALTCQSGLVDTVLAMNLAGIVALYCIDCGMVLLAIKNTPKLSIMYLCGKLSFETCIFYVFMYGLGSPWRDIFYTILAVYLKSIKRSLKTIK